MLADLSCLLRLCPRQTLLSEHVRLEALGSSSQVLIEHLGGLALYEGLPEAVASLLELLFQALLSKIAVVRVERRAEPFFLDGLCHIMPSFERVLQSRTSGLALSRLG